MVCYAAALIKVLPFQKIGDHYNIEVGVAGQLYRIAVDVYSTLKGSPKFDPQDKSAVWDEDRLLLFYLDDQYAHPLLTALLQTAQGFTYRAQLPAILQLDYLREQPALFPISQMKVVPPKQADNDGNDLNDDIDPWIQKPSTIRRLKFSLLVSFWNDAGSAHPRSYDLFQSESDYGCACCPYEPGR